MNAHHAVQVWLQDFAWAEADTPARLERRAGYAEGPAERRLLAEAPLFCFETGLKLPTASAAGGYRKKVAYGVWLSLHSASVGSLRRQV